MKGKIYTDNIFSDKKITLKEILFIIIIAVTTITIFSKSSPCYPLNDWVDTNIFLTVGKSLVHGQVLYQDIYEQKGPLLFFLYIIPALISETSFIGVYFLEIISAFFFLYFSYKITSLYTEKSIYFLPVFSFIIFSTESFSQGGSVEELCLPMLTCSLYFLIKSLHNGTNIISIKQAFTVGIFIGCILWIKYTILGMYFGYALVVIIMCIKKKQIARMFKIALAVLSGIVIVSIPVFIYFAINHALDDLFTVYFYNNLFLYGNDAHKSLLYFELHGVKAFCYHNRIIFASLFAGMILMFLFNNQLFAMVLICIVPTAALLYVRYCGAYYHFILCAFMPLCWIFIYNFLRNIVVKIRIKKKYILPVIIVVFQVAVCSFCFTQSPNIYMFLKSKDELPQYKMAKIINQYDDRSIFNYDVLDVGLYTTTGTVPNTRYFCTFNVNAPGMDEEQLEYIESGKTNFIVTRDKKLNASNYRLIDTEQYYYEDEMRTYYLYKRN